jgi:hypothetical protein
LAKAAARGRGAASANDGPPQLTLKQGDQVMLAANLSVKDGLVNGARGVVLGFRTHAELEAQGKPFEGGADGEAAFHDAAREEPLVYPDEPIPLCRFEGADGKPVELLVPY